MGSVFGRRLAPKWASACATPLRRPYRISSEELIQNAMVFCLRYESTTQPLTNLEWKLAV
jgi:hypothetical protein